MTVKAVTDLIIYAPDDDAIDAIYRAMHVAAEEHGANVHLVEKFREDND